METSSRIADLEHQISERDKRIAADGARIAAADVRTAALEREVFELSALVDTLMKVVGRNSRNSHLPPSSDGPGARGGGTAGGAGKRGRGGQRGHKGAKRVLLPKDEVTNFIHLYPEACESCWQPLPRCPSESPSRYQNIDINGPALKVTEYQRHTVRCCCGFSTRAKVVGVVPASPFGPGLMARVCALTGTYKMSRREAVSLMQDFFDVKISVGSISAIERRVSAALELPVAEVKKYVNAAPVKHADATSWLHKGKLRSLWTIATADASFYDVLPNGRAETIKPMFGIAAGILVSDRATVFSFWPMERRQICWAHLLRKFVEFAEMKAAAHTFGCELIQAAALVFRYWKDFRANKIDRTTLQHWIAPLRQQVEKTLLAAQKSNIKSLSGSCENILEHRDALWKFVVHEGVEPTNNHAERELRSCVIWRRRSFGSQSDEGEKYAARIMTVVQTARKRGINVLQFLAQCCTAWLEHTAAPCLLTTR